MLRGKATLSVSLSSSTQTRMSTQAMFVSWDERKRRILPRHLDKTWHIHGSVRKRERIMQVWAGEWLCDEMLLCEFPIIFSLRAPTLHSSEICLFILFFCPSFWRLFLECMNMCFRKVIFPQFFVELSISDSKECKYNIWDFYWFDFKIILKDFITLLCCKWKVGSGENSAKPWSKYPF